MKKAWRAVLLAVLVLAVAGIVCGAIGLITGASLDRMVENIFGGWEALEMVLDVLMRELGALLPGEYGVTIIGG